MLNNDIRNIYHMTGDEERASTITKIAIISLQVSILVIHAIVLHMYVMNILTKLLIQWLIYITYLKD